MGKSRGPGAKVWRPLQEYRSWGQGVQQKIEWEDQKELSIGGNELLGECQAGRDQTGRVGEEERWADFSVRPCGSGSYPTDFRYEDDEPADEGDRLWFPKDASGKAR